MMKEKVLRVKSLDELPETDKWTAAEIIKPFKIVSIFPKNGKVKKEERIIT